MKQSSTGSHVGNDHGARDQVAVSTHKELGASRDAGPNGTQHKADTTGVRRHCEKVSLTPERPRHSFLFRWFKRQRNLSAPTSHTGGIIFLVP